MNLTSTKSFYDRELDRSLSLSINGELDSAEMILRQLDQNDPRVRFNLGWFDMRHGFLKKGYEGLDFGRGIGVFGSEKKPKTLEYENQSLIGRTLLFIGEGGLGDEIMNIRFAKKFHDMGAKVILGCSAVLYPIFSKISHISALVEREVCDQAYHDYWISGMSAPKYLGLEYEELDGTPYLDIFEPRKLYPKNKKLKVGIRWAGNPRFEHQQHRRFPVKKMLELSKIENVSLYSLQRDEDLVNNSSFIDFRYELKSWKDTAEIIAGLDLIVTSCTSVAHLAGAMGKPTWIIVPILPYYPWALPINNSPWYKSVKLYRQTKYGNWDEPFDKIKEDLKKLQTIS